MQSDPALLAFFLLLLPLVLPGQPQVQERVKVSCRSEMALCFGVAAFFILILFKNSCIFGKSEGRENRMWRVGGWDGILL